MSHSIIAIGGDLGSGKSTVARLVADLLGLTLYSTGGIQRALAAELGVSSLELNQMAESDPSIDERIDNRTIEYAATEKQVLFDSRLAWHLVPHSFKVFLTVDPGVAAHRIYAANRGPVEQYGSVERAAADLNARRASENMRYAELYGVNPEDLSNYNLTIDTSQAEPAQVAEKILTGFREWQSGSFSAQAWLSPRTPFPTQTLSSQRPTSVSSLGPPELGDRGQKPPSTHPSIHSSAPLFPSAQHSTPNTPPESCQLIRIGRYFFILHGHHFVSAALRDNSVFIQTGVPIHADDVISGVRASQFVERECTLDRVSDWETAHQFHYLSYPPFLSR